MTYLGYGYHSFKPYCCECKPPELNTYKDFSLKKEEKVLDKEERLEKLENYIENLEDFKIIDSMTELREIMYVFVEDVKILKDNINSYDNMENFKNILDRLEKLENFRASQLNLSLREKIEITQEFLNLLQDRVAKLETHIDDILLDFEKRIVELKRFQDITHLEFKQKKTPYRCPVCEGLMYVENKEKTIGSRCNACEGKGIIWS